MNQQKGQQILKGTIILSIAALITKILSAVYRVPFQNIAGDVGFYIYQQVYPFYGITFILATYGFPAMISKLISDDLQKGGRNRDQIVCTAFIILFLLNSICFSLLFFGANQISYVMGDAKLTPLIQAVAFSYLFIPFISVLRGSFQGHQNMLPTAVSQTIEQIIRVGFILLFSYVLFHNGYSVYAIGIGAIVGSVLGSFFSTLTLFIFSRKKRIFSSIHLRNLKFNKYLKTIIFYGIAISASHLLFILIQFVDAMTIYSLLVNSGVDTTLAKEAKGIFDRGSPLIQLGTVIATSLSLTLVPLISSGKLKENTLFVQEKVDLSIRVSIFVGAGASAGLMSIIKPTNIMLFTDSSGSDVLRILAVAILFSSITLTSASILIGLNRPYRSSLFIGVSLIMKLLLNIALVPLAGTSGAAISTIGAFSVAMLLHTWQLKRDMGVSIFRRSAIRSILLATVGMVIALLLFQQFVHLFVGLVESPRLFAAFQAISSVIVGGVVYLVLVIKLKIFTYKELSFLPLGKRLIRFIGKKEGEKHA